MLALALSMSLADQTKEGYHSASTSAADSHSPAGASLTLSEHGLVSQRLAGSARRSESSLDEFSLEASSLDDGWSVCSSADGDQWQMIG